MKTLHPYFADNLRAQMERAGVTQSELQRQLGLGPGLIWHYLNRTKEPPLHRLEELAAALKTTSGKLLAKPK